MVEDRVEKAAKPVTETEFFQDDLRTVLGVLVATKPDISSQNMIFYKKKRNATKLRNINFEHMQRCTLLTHVLANAHCGGFYISAYISCLMPKL